jgi:hypothetical protein
MICRLRLWIELLKNAYYTENSKYTELETLPNIDINIKTGNSLISRFPLNADLSKALKSIKYDIKAYQGFVNDYKNANDKELKKGLIQIINSIKSDFRSEIQNNDPKLIKLNKMGGELFSLLNQKQIFEPTAKEKATRKQQKEKLEADINKLSAEVEDIKNNAIYRNAFEWRFEFPEVLDENGDFIGFDVIIGNPPYGVKPSGGLKQYYSSTYQVVEDIYTIFIEKGLNLIHKRGTHSFINPITWLTNDNYVSTRQYIADKAHLTKGIILPYDIFEDAYVDTGVFIFDRYNEEKLSHVFQFSPRDKVNFYSLIQLIFQYSQRIFG